MENYSVKEIRKEFKENGVFYTPPELARFLKSFVDREVKEVYDPTCGAGNLLSEFKDNVKKYGQDISEDAVNFAKSKLKNFEGVAGDTLKEPAFLDRKFECIVANPPFSVKWEPVEDDIRFKNAPTIPTASKADYAFILHILHYLKHDGIAIVMNFPGILYRKSREGKIRQWLTEKNYIDKVVHIPGDKFTDTNIATCLLILKKNKETTDVEFLDDELKISRIVSFEEIKNNDFVLSVSSYIQKFEKKEEIDEIELERQAREDLISEIEKSLNMSLMIYGLQEESKRLNYLDFINKIADVLEKYTIKFKEIYTWF